MTDRKILNDIFAGEEREKYESIEGKGNRRKGKRQRRERREEKARERGKGWERKRVTEASTDFHLVLVL